MKNQQTVSLVLGSGGARGLAHIGVIRYLEEQNFKIISISGCSMGAAVGGVYAAGKLTEFENWITAISKFDIISLLDISWQKTGLIKGDKIINTLIDLVGDKKIEDLPIKYTAVAVDIKNGKEVWINTGKLFDAIRASISLPLFFTPFNRNGVDLIDGGVLNPVPIAPTFSDGSDITIAVNLGGEPVAQNTKNIQKIKNKNDKENLSVFNKKVQSYIQKFSDKMQNTAKFDIKAYNIANQAFDAMQSTIARQKLASYPPDYTINIPINSCNIFEFDKADEMIKLGYNLTQQKINNIKI
ncbi:MAG: serine protease [Gammaproteobacteria bacterium]|nr:MAG: serine protease [Gammaproteobacteria bacterium]